MEAYLTQILTQHPLLAPIIFILVRTVPVIIPPIPGVVVDLVGVAMFGWKLGLFLALIGAHIGASVAFFIARYYRESAVKYFVPLQKLHELEAQYSEHQKFWALVGVRFITSPFFDYMSFAAGLTRMSYLTFLASTFLGVLPYAFTVYFFGGLSLDQGPLFAILFFLGLAIMGGLAGKVFVEKFWNQK